ncbi:hypothetical protein L226DRAFT_299260 [Lentinus tigrinus ALCF2SS1-7]|uniref:uncharacterized protein n=1 Tax=Lentinus tigrinus ALCF2SS1-7 TaxID=1328758 RepID=UPI001165E477|nr:hypothetical protein L226DRAFT_299260 [Lentinus tigrinus ALCF2SS1-7]
MLGSLLKEHFVEAFENLAFMKALVSHMSEEPHEKWPSIDAVVEEFRAIVSQLSKPQMRKRLIVRKRRSVHHVFCLDAYPCKPQVARTLLIVHSSMDMPTSPACSTSSI